MPLSDAKIRAIKPGDKEQKHFDGGGLYLLVRPNGSRYWRMKYRFAGREGKLSFGVYPAVSLKEARELRDEARRQIRDGIDPAVQRRVAKHTATGVTFREVAEEWLTMIAKPTRKKTLSSKTIKQHRQRLEDYVYPGIGNRPINAITAPEVLSILSRVEKCGFIETAHRVRSICSRIFRFAIATSRCEQDPAAALIDALPPVVVTHHAALTDPRAVGELLRAVDGYRGQPSTQYALRILPYVFLRSSELRNSKWSYIDFDTAEWRVPADRMKMREMHVAPLARQVVEMLRDLHSITGHGELIFPGLRPKRPISENTINGALRRLGYSGDEMTGHGFRTIASTFLNEQGWNEDVIELQLAHKERKESRAAYNRAQRLADRRRMMQAWADYLDALKAGGNVIAIHSRRA